MVGGGIPKNWIGCPKMSTGLVDELFFTFKTPLSAELNRNLDIEGQFHPETVFQEFKKFTNRPILWIDLTNTSRYYRKEIVQKNGIEYIKMAMEGHGTAPSVKQRLQFSNLCDNFLNKNQNGCIAVHCTHGFNRTGFLICNYLILHKKYNAHQAITEFTKHRPPGIYRQNYVQSLYEIYQENVKKLNLAIEDMPPPPIVITPQWADEKNNIITTGGHQSGRPGKREWTSTNGKNHKQSKTYSDINIRNGYSTNSTNRPDRRQPYNQQCRQPPSWTRWSRPGYQQQQQQEQFYNNEPLYMDSNWRTSQSPHMVTNSPTPSVLPPFYSGYFGSPLIQPPNIDWSETWNWNCRREDNRQ